MRSAQAISSSNIIGRRLDLSSRHTSYQIKEMLKGKVFEHLFVEELLVDPKNKSSAAP
jgi:hypothetical protein